MTLKLAAIKSTGFWGISFVLCGLLFVQPVSAEIYKYTDALGRVYFTDRPMKGDYSLKGVIGKPKRRSSYDAGKYRRNRLRYSTLIDAAARRSALQPELLHAVVHVESSYDPSALSRAGAAGLMQLMPDTARRYGVNDRWDPKQNLDGGARYLRDLLKLFESDLKLALAAYNAGENAVKKYGNQIPPFPETRRYVQKVLSVYEQAQAVN